MAMALLQRALLVIALLSATAACGGGDDLPDPGARFDVRSEDYAEGEEIPQRHTCEGEDLAPSVRWSGVPEDAVELVLVLDDPDASGGAFTHWLVAGIDPGADGVDTGSAGVVEGRNDFGASGYRGPCPPRGGGAHGYVLTIYALDSPTALEPGFTTADLRAELGGQALARGDLVGRYARP
jgi:Raf kinase inhibitor-like YbhB/YbcL family protein